MACLLTVLRVPTRRRPCRPLIVPVPVDAPRTIAPTAELAPATRVPAKADWSSYLAALARRGRLTAVFHPDHVARWERARTRGRPYPVELVVALSLLQAATGWSLRRTLGFAADQAALARRDIALPDAATFCRRRRDPEVVDALSRAGFAALEAASSGPVTLLLDATGVSLRRDGDWHRNKHKGGGDRRRGRFVKLHAGVDEATGAVVAAAVTGGDGRGSGDASQGPALIREAASRVRVGAVVGDGAYDSKACHAVARGAGATMIAPPHSGAAYGLHPDRDRHLAQVGRIGEAEWKRRVGYHRRSLVESAFGALKDATGHSSRATSRAGATSEVLARIALHNQWAVDVATTLTPVHPTWAARQKARTPAT